MAEQSPTTRRAFMSATGRMAAGAAAVAALASCAVAPAFAEDGRALTGRPVAAADIANDKMAELIDAHRKALAIYDVETEKLEALEAKAPKGRARIVLSKNGPVIATTTDFIRQVGAGDEVWIAAKFAELKAARAAYWQAWRDSGVYEQDAIAVAAERAEGAARGALVSYRPRTLAQVGLKAAYFAECKSFVEWATNEREELFASLAPAAA